MKELLKYDHILITPHLNFLDIPITRIDTDEEGVKEWNSIIALIQDQEKAGDYKELRRTPSGGISISVENWSRFPGYDIQTSKSMAELTVIDIDGCWRFQFRQMLQKGKNISGRTSYLKFEEVCARFGIDLRKMMLPTQEEGEKVKTQIPPPRIDMRSDLLNLTFSNANHIDIHSAHMAGVAFAFPELLEPILHCYENRKRYAIYKSILTHTWGYFQSKWSPVYYRLSHLAKAGLEYTNTVVNDLTERLEASGRLVIGHNTDGIWYVGEPYHGEGEGPDLGQWQNDIINTKFRAKSTGVFEYIENDGKYHPTVRGKTTLDKIKPREEWAWGDIYNYGAIPLFYIRDDGIIEKREVDEV